MAGGPIAPSSVYLGGASGNLFPNFYICATNTDGGGFDEGIGVVASLGADATAYLRFPIPPTVPTGTLKLRLLAQANALALVPRPLQQPHPPLWQVIDTPRSIQWAAEHGLQGMFWIPPVQSLKDRFELYRDTASKARGRDVKLGEGLCLVRDLYVAETMEEAKAAAGEGVLAYLRWVCHWRGLGNHLMPG